MPDSRSPLVSGWIAKAEEDLQVARLLIAQERRHLSVAVYHCQQSAEKALKGMADSPCSHLSKAP